MAGVLDSIPTGGNFLMNDFFAFPRKPLTPILPTLFNYEKPGVESYRD